MAKLDVALDQKRYDRGYKDVLKGLVNKEIDIAERGSSIRIEVEELSSSPAISVLFVSYLTALDVQEGRDSYHQLALLIPSKDLLLFARQLLSELLPTTEDLILEELRSLKKYLRNEGKK